MKAYVATTGGVFGLLVLAHVARIVTEGPQVMRDPFFVAMAAVALALGLWAAYVLRHSSGRADP